MLLHEPRQRLEGLLTDGISQIIHAREQLPGVGQRLEREGIVGIVGVDLVKPSPRHPHGEEAVRRAPRRVREALDPPKRLRTPHNPRAAGAIPTPMIRGDLFKNL